MGELISFSELNYKELFEALPGMFIALKPDFTIAAVSNQFLKVSMTTREKVIGTYLFDLFPDNPADPDTKGVENLKASLQYVLASKEQHTMVLQKYDIRRPDGRFEVRYWSPVNSPVVDENNEIKFIIHRVEDVTDFVMAKENQYLNRNSDKPLENIEAELFEQEKELKIVNLAKQELENKVKQRTEELLKANEDYKELAKELENKVLIRTSELNAEREKLFNLFMNAPAIICVFKGPEHIFEFANPLYYQLYGNRELIGKTVREALPELEGQVFFDLLDNVYKTGKTFTGKEIPGQINKKYDGNLEEVYFNFVYEPVYNIKNEVEGISVFAFDITEQVMARKQVEKLNHSKKVFGKSR